MFADLASLGFSYGDVVKVLEQEGVQKFGASWQQMRDSLAQQLAAAGQ